MMMMMMMLIVIMRRRRGMCMFKIKIVIMVMITMSRFLQSLTKSNKLCVLARMNQVIGDDKLSNRYEDNTSTLSRGSTPQH
ncbi:hypothetical protein FGIG_11373 [Fasciola gigantica]|uniref:Uncharacterized protein n=1 Tax=Fasciola gigantica TaxID=46835 RepID=A0A504Y5E8_FASGI|nr:hypothetical protein FGIG_11373 [Fasciola gigantica]